ncbi:MAG: phosphotransferase [Mucilaginibacter polytrichastri]|nr:phosphotransferase [Mucilaginibacter polytrichastri]
MKKASPSIEEYLLRWQLLPDGEAFHTNTSTLQPVIFSGRKAMLKIAHHEEERRGAHLMIWWNGRSSARIYRSDARALLMERGDTQKLLVKMAHAGEDEAATRIICEVIRNLHQPQPDPPALVPLQTWFSDLEDFASTKGGLFADGWRMAAELLPAQENAGALHGDIHHGNILWGEKGWFAIDPKGLYGERTFDYANLFCNPDVETATSRPLFHRRLGQVSALAGVAPMRLLQWIAAWSALSAAWQILDGQNADGTLQITRLALYAVEK